ncbi:MAG: CoA transferase [Pseudomonadota bacterium]
MAVTEGHGYTSRMGGALHDITVVDLAGNIATSYCAKMFADYGAQVVNVEPTEGFSTRQLAPFTAGGESAMHAYLHTNKKSVSGYSANDLQDLLDDASLILGDAQTPTFDHDAIFTRVTWYGSSGPYAHYVGSDAQCFALNAMLPNIGHVAGPPLIPTGYQAQIVAGKNAYVASLTQLLGRKLGNTTSAIDIEVSTFESMLCLTEVGVIGAYNTGLTPTRMGINRFPPTYPLGVFPCQDGWLGLTVLTPGQWHAFCDLLDMPDFKHVDLFQTAVGRLEAVDVIEPVIRERLLTRKAEALFYAGQQARIPLARVPTMAELFQVDQFQQRQAFGEARLSDGTTLAVPSVPFRLFATPPNFGGPVAALGEHTAEFVG